MNFYHRHMENGKLVNEIDKEDIYSHLEITVYMAKKKYYEKLAKADATNF